MPKQEIQFSRITNGGYYAEHPEQEYEALIQPVTVTPDGGRHLAKGYRLSTLTWGRPLTSSTHRLLADAKAEARKTFETIRTDR